MGSRAHRTQRQGGARDRRWAEEAGERAWRIEEATARVPGAGSERSSGRCQVPEREYWKGRIQQAQKQITQIEAKLKAE